MISLEWIVFLGRLNIFGSSSCSLTYSMEEMIVKLKQWCNTSSSYSSTEIPYWCVTEAISHSYSLSSFNKDLKASFQKVFFSLPLQRLVAIGVIILRSASSSCPVLLDSSGYWSFAISKGLELCLLRDKSVVSSSSQSRKFSSSESVYVPSI